MASFLDNGGLRTTNSQVPDRESRDAKPAELGLDDREVARVFARPRIQLSAGQALRFHSSVDDPMASRKLSCRM